MVVDKYEYIISQAIFLPAISLQVSVENIPGYVELLEFLYLARQLTTRKLCHRQNLAAAPP